MKPTKLSFKGDKKKKRKREKVEQEDSLPEETSDRGWLDARDVSDVSGPICLIFNSEPMTCIAYHEVTGKIYVQPMNSEDPEQVNQVWIANRIVDSDRFTLKSAQGKYLAYDSQGGVSATREAIGPQEEWIPAFRSDLGGFVLQTAAQGDSTLQKYLSVDEIAGGEFKVVADSDSAGFGETFRIRSQARFRSQQSKKQKAAEDADLTTLESESIKKYQARNIGRLVVSTDNYKELKRAQKTGQMAEALLDRREKIKSDKFCK